jgi:hypothetical protein
VLTALACGALPSVAAELPTITIAARRHSPTLDLAADELAKYLVRMAGARSAAVVLKPEEGAKADLRLGVFTDFGVSTAGLQDPARDDAIHLSVRNSKGVIAGSNERSTLIAAYRFLWLAGCRWPRPGKDGEVVPSRPVRALTANLDDRAFYRFRGNNNCGSYPVESILDAIEWSPKVGLNTWFNEFTNPKRLYNRWYEHTHNFLKTPSPRSDEELMSFHDRTVAEIKRRGMIYHAVGHGWTGAALGLTDSQVNDPAYRITGDRAKLLAEVGGERKTNAGGPVFTELCYGNPEVRQRMVRAVAEYAAAHPEVDVVHFWLSDGFNNQCECDRCRTSRPADFYVQMLNEIDRELTTRRLGTRIAFLLYHELLWAPQKQRFENPARFVLMFAPPGEYGQVFDPSVAASAMPPYIKNKVERPPRQAAPAFLREWRRIFSGEGFTFDYQLVWHHYFDQGYYGMVPDLAGNIRQLKDLGLSGYVSCQNLRAAFPTNYPKYAHARLLWEPKADLEEVAREYFRASFGVDWEAARRYMSRLSDRFDAVAAHRFAVTVKVNKAETNAALAAKLAGVPAVVEEFRPMVERNLQSPDRVQAASWRYLFLHSELATLLSHSLRAKAVGNRALSLAYGEQVVRYAATNDDQTAPVFDLYYFLNTMSGRGVLKLIP